MTEASVEHIHQCPFCELRFSNVNETRDHIVRDHSAHASAFADIPFAEHRPPAR